MEGLTLSVCRVAGLESPAFFDLRVVSIRSGTNLLLGGSDISGTCSLCGVEIGGFSVAGGDLHICPLLLLTIVSTGSGTNRRFGAKSFSDTISFFREMISFLLLLVTVSTGSGANRLVDLTVVSTGIGEKRLVGGGGEERPDMICW